MPLNIATASATSWWWSIPRCAVKWKRLVGEMGYTKVRVIIDGGDERVDSTAAALDMLATAGIPDDAKILIHDAVRPFVEQSAIDGSIDALDQFTAATVAYASTDTVLLTEDLGDLKVVKSVPDRPNTFRAQTPQSFRFATIRHAYDLAAATRTSIPPDDTRVVVDYLPDEPRRHCLRCGNQPEDHHAGRYSHS